MAWGEPASGSTGPRTRRSTRTCSTTREARPARNAERKKVVHPDEMPWEMSRQGLLKHLINEA